MSGENTPPMAVAESHTAGGFLRRRDVRSCSAAELARSRLRQIAARADLTPTRLGGLEVLHRGDDHFLRLLEAFSTAERELSVEIYQVRRDPVGRQLLEALAAAAERGVRVRLLTDAFGSARVADWIEGLRRRRVEVCWYGAWSPATSPLRRTHRKLVIVDGQTASIGGINFAEEFSECHRGPQVWRDVAVWFRGPAAAVLRRQFEAAWRDEGGAPGEFLAVDPTSDELAALAGGVDGRTGHAATWHALVASARSEVLLATPYFLPDAQFRRRLIDAVERGVRVVVVIPRRCDIRWFMHAGRRSYADLLRAGVEIWERCDRMVHAKVGVADGSVAAVGSANLNRRSFHGNSETLMVTTSRRVVDGIHRLVTVESAASADVLRVPDWRRHPTRARWAELLATPMACVF
jgi:cardiolipin synthase